jgi:osmoprotectant transport system substrate-binding protein
VAVVIAVLSALAACGSGEDAPDAVTREGAVRVGSFDFPESELLARLYGEALRDAGYDVELLLGLGPRELVTPALHQGLVDVVPEYLGTALEFLSLGETPAGSEPGPAHRALVGELAGGPLQALDPAPAQDANAFVVTAATAATLDLQRVSDLRRVAGQMVFAGPPECPSRPFCLAGLADVYGVEFGTVLSLDAGGPLTLQALEAAQADVALLFTTDPAVDGEAIVALADDRSLQPAENVTPVVRRDLVAEHGDPLVRVLDEVSADLATEDLRAMNGAVRDGRRAEIVVREWLDGRGGG